MKIHRDMPLNEHWAMEDLRTKFNHFTKQMKMEIKHTQAYRIQQQKY